MKILFLTQWFDPEPTPKGLDFARALVKAGHSVEVVTGFPNYPSGKIYPGYRVKWIQNEIIDGVNITRVPLYPNHDSSAIKRILNYLSFSFTSCMYGLFFMKKPDVIYIYHPPMSVGFSGAVIGLFRRVPFVMDIQDMWPDTLPATGMLNHKKILKIVGYVCQWVYKRAAKLVVISPGFKKLLIERGVPENKIEIIYNWANESVLRNPVPFNLDGIFDQEKLNIVFAGNMGKAQALNSVLEAAQKIENKNSNIQFTFVGGGLEVENLKQIVKNKRISSVQFLDNMPMNQIGSVLSSADILLVHLSADPLFEITIPSKTQAYLSIGKPIIMAVKGDAADLIHESESGYCVAPEDSSQLASKILEIANVSSVEIQKKGLNGRAFYDEHLSFDAGVYKTLAILESALHVESKKIKRQ